jgi:TPR repeat protein
LQPNETLELINDFKRFQIDYHLANFDPFGGGIFYCLEPQMKPELPPVSPAQFRPTSYEIALYDRLKLPNGLRVGEVTKDISSLELYCQSHFSLDWISVKYEAILALSDRVFHVENQLPALEALLAAGQPPDSLRSVFCQILETLDELLSDGSLNAQLLIGMAHFRIGHFFDPEHSESNGAEALDEAIRLGNKNGFFLLGDRYLATGKVQKAIDTYREGSEQGCSVCCYQLAQLIECGAGSLTKNAHAAFTLYRRAYEANYPPAGVSMVRLWLQSTEALPLPGEPALIVSDLMDMKCSGATMLQAELHERGGEGQYLPMSAISLYRCAAVQGDPAAQLKLASILSGSYQGELSMTPDENEAIQWYERVCGLTDCPPSLLRQAHMELGSLLMWRKMYEAAASIFYTAVQLGAPEAVQLQKLCEEMAERQQSLREEDGCDITEDE